jgi:predicted transcriptional regulator
MEPMSDQLLSLAAQIVSAHVKNNAVPANELPALIQSIYTTLTQAGAQPPVPEKQEPAVPIKKSVFADHIVCLEKAYPGVPGSARRPTIC